MKVDIRNEGGYWSVYVNGVRTIDRESRTVAERVALELRHPSARYTESADVARSIRQAFAAKEHVHNFDSHGCCWTCLASQPTFDEGEEGEGE